MKQIIPGLWEIDEIGDAVHCYLWEWSEGLTLIDTGRRSDGPKILEALRRHRMALHNIRRIIITHVDADHTGGLALLQRVTAARVACHTTEKAVMEQPARRKPGAWYTWPLYPLAQLVPALYQHPVTPHELLVDGQTLPEGFTVVHTPGHTPGHISLLHTEKRLLIAGDALVNRRNRLSVNISAFTADPFNARRSLLKLAKKHGDDFDVIVFGHGMPVLHNGAKRVKGLASQIFSTDV